MQSHLLTLEGCRYSSQADEFFREISRTQTISEQEKIDLAIRAISKWGHALSKDLIAILKPNSSTAKVITDRNSQMVKLFTVQKEMSKNAMASRNSYSNFFTMNALDLTSPLLETEEAKNIKLLFPEAKFYEYTHYVGQEKTCILVEINGVKYQLTKQSSSYIEDYQISQPLLNRPPFRTMHLSENSYIFLQEFMGSTSPDVCNPEHLSQLAKLFATCGCHRQTVNVDRGNLIVSRGKIFYTRPKIDGCSLENAKEDNLKNLHYLIKTNVLSEKEREILLKQATKIFQKECLKLEKRIKWIDLTHKMEFSKMLNYICLWEPNLRYDQDSAKEAMAAILQRWGSSVRENVQRYISLTAESSKAISGVPIAQNTVSMILLAPSSTLLKGSEATTLKQKFPNAVFYEYTNRVGNYKNVLLVEIEGKKYVVRRSKLSYIEAYKKLQQSEHRPNFIVIPSEMENSENNPESEFLFLAEFIGPETIDFRNREQLALLARLGAAFAKNENVFDNNLGNIVVHGGQLYYIDKDLFYVGCLDKEGYQKKNLESICSMLASQGFPYEELESLLKFVKEEFDMTLKNASFG